VFILLQLPVPQLPLLLQPFGEPVPQLPQPIYNYVQFKKNCTIKEGIMSRAEE
jgi:hypothetical protein